MPLFVIHLLTWPLKFKRGEGTLDDQRRDGGTNFVLRIKEQATRLILHEYDDEK